MKKILLQLDSDLQPSSFDRIVAFDAGVDEVLSYGNVQPEQVESLTHGAMFTRGPKDLKNTAIFIGGSDPDQGIKLLQRAEKAFFGPVRVSLMIDCNGSNTTAAAAVLSARRHIDLAGSTSVIFGGTGPVGQRVAELLAAAGGTVRITSRDVSRAEEVCQSLRDLVPDGRIEPHETCTREAKQRALDGVQAIFAAGAAGAQFLSEQEWSSLETVSVAVDLNAVPPVGLAGIAPQDAAVQRGRIFCYGALGVGGLKMKIHRQALCRLFESNKAVLGTQAIFQLAVENFEKAG